MNKISLTVLASLFACSTYAAAGAVATTGFTSLGTVDVCDDCYTGAVALGFTANFFGNTSTDIYVSNNGYITFGNGQGTYTPTGLTANYSGAPIIAPFFADVDTRGAAGGTVTYGSGTYAGNSAVEVTWDKVGYYNAQSDKLNTFQLVLVNRGDTGTGNFDVYFNYDKIVWETGSASAGSGGFGGVSAAAGYANGSGGAGTYAQLTGSLVNGALLDGGVNALTGHSNTGVLGQYVFQVRNGGVIAPPVPEPETYAMMLAGLGLVGALARRRNRAGKAA